MYQDNVRCGEATYLANAAIAEGLCLIHTTTARTVGVPTVGKLPVYVASSASTAADEQIQVVPLDPATEVRVRANGTITAGDLCEIVLSGADAGKVVTLATGTPRFVAIESAVDEDIFLARPLASTGRAIGQPTPVTLNATATMADGDITAGIITSTTGAATTGTTRTGTQLDAELPQIPIGGFTDVIIINTGGNTFTLAGGSGVTIVGLATVATLTSGTFRFKRTAAATWVAYRK